MIPEEGVPAVPEVIPAFEETAIKNAIVGLTSGVEEATIVTQLQNPRAAHQFTEEEALSIVDRAKARMAEVKPPAVEVAKPPVEHRGTEPEGIAIGNELGIAYDGVQKDIGMQFTDVKETGTTFYAQSLEEAKTKLAKKRKLFEVPKPPAVEVKFGGGNPMKTETQRKSFHERIFGKGSTPPLERLGQGETLNNLLPMSPEEGPPLPKMFALRWPWKK